MAYGIHPDTDEPYQWVDKSLVDIAFDDLPVVTEEQIVLFLDATRSSADHKCIGTPVGDRDFFNQISGQILCHSLDGDWGDGCLNTACKLIAEAKQGEQEPTLYAASNVIGGVVQGGALESDTARQALCEAGGPEGL